MIPVMSLTVFGLAVFLLLLGTPVFVSIGLASVMTIIIHNPVPLISIPQLMFSGTESYVLVAIPLFVLSGVLMESTGVAKKLIDFAKAGVGWARGGLGGANVVASFIFGGMSGSSVADTVALGTILIPEMEADGYDKGYSAAITALSSTLAVIVPPSILMVIIGAVSELSVSWLLIGGLGPGVLLTVSMMIQNYFICRKNNYGSVKKFSFRALWDAFRVGIWALGAPVIIMLGIMTGFVTPTESGGLAVVYTIVISLFFYKSLKKGVIYKSLISAARLTAAVVAIIGSSSIFTFILTFEGLPQIVAGFLLGITNNQLAIFLMINVFLLIMGMFLDAGVAIIVMAPILFPVAAAVGIHPIHFAVVFVLNLAIGMVTPPFGVCLFSTCNVAKMEMGQLIRSALPLYLSMLAVLLLTTLVPGIVLWIPTLTLG
ncbi:MAG TPA: C4-dicarboxylate ABC transporter permease [Sphaerochaeta sp.]|nr:C4-dicarboxylate ABC transporter permease [Sphaerochaeta sp.]